MKKERNEERKREKEEKGEKEGERKRERERETIIKQAKILTEVYSGYVNMDNFYFLLYTLFR